MYKFILNIHVFSYEDTVGSTETHQPEIMTQKSNLHTEQELNIVLSDMRKCNLLFISLIYFRSVGCSSKAGRKTDARGN